MITAYDKYDYYYIAFIDILGFKDMINKKPCSYIWDVYNYNMTRNPMLDIFDYKGNSAFDMSAIKMKVMSDSVIFYVRADVKNSFFALVISCLEFQTELLTRNDPVLSRGGITYGEMFVGETKLDADVMFGPGFVEAYLLQEKNAKVPRIITNKMTLDLAKKDMDDEFKKRLDENLFIDSDEFYVLDYCKKLQRNNQNCNNLYAYIEKILSSCNDLSVREKYLYLKKNLLKSAGKK